MLEFDQKNIFVKIPFERSISWFQNNKKTKKRHVSFKDEMWPQNKMHNGKNFITTWLTVNALLGSTILAISVFTEQFRSLVILRMFWQQNDQWQASSQIPLVFCSPICGLDSCNYSIEMAEDPTMTSHLLSGLYHLENGGCMGFNWVRQKVWNLTDASSPTWVADKCQSWQRHLSSWCYSETWLNQVTMVSHLQSHLLIHLSSLFWNSWQNLQSFSSS